MSPARLIIAGTHSGVGKTTVTIGLMAALTQRCSGFLSPWSPGLCTPFVQRWSHLAHWIQKKYLRSRLPHTSLDWYAFCDTACKQPREHTKEHGEFVTNRICGGAILGLMAATTLK